VEKMNGNQMEAGRDYLFRIFHGKESAITYFVQKQAEQ
jgi:hypothetical protein